MRWHSHLLPQPQLSSCPQPSTVATPPTAWRAYWRLRSSSSRTARRCQLRSGPPSPRRACRSATHRYSPPSPPTRQAGKGMFAAQLPPFAGGSGQQQLSWTSVANAAACCSQIGTVPLYIFADTMAILPRMSLRIAVGADWEDADDDSGGADSYCRGALAASCSGDAGYGGWSAATKNVTTAAKHCYFPAVTQRTSITGDTAVTVDFVAVAVTAAVTTVLAMHILSTFRPAPCATFPRSFACVYLNKQQLHISHQSINQHTRAPKTNLY